MHSAAPRSAGERVLICPLAAQIACPANTGSPAGASSAVNCTSLPGYFGSQGVAAIPCTVGSYCPGGGQLIACPAGYALCMSGTCACSL